MDKVHDKIVQWDTYNYQPGDAWSMFLNSGYEWLIVPAVMTLLIVGIVGALWLIHRLDRRDDPPDPKRQ